MSLKEDWSQRVSWSDGVFESLERFVDSKPSENIRQFAESGEIDKLYDGFTPPEPQPSAMHIEYMEEYAQKVVNEKESN